MSCVGLKMLLVMPWLLIVWLTPMADAACPRGCKCTQTVITCTDGGTISLDSIPDSIENLTLSDVELRYMSTTYESVFRKLIHLKMHRVTFNGRDIGYGMFAGFTRLKTLDISYSKARAINSRAFANIVGADLIRISYLEVNDIATDAFTNFNNITRFEFIGNKFKTIARNAFHTFKRVRMFHFEGASREVSFKANTFYDFVNIERILFRDMHIKNIASRWMENTKKIRELQFDRVTMDYIPAQFLQEIHVSKRVILRQLTVKGPIKANAFQKIKNLDHFELSFSSVAGDVQTDAFHHFQDVKTISIHDNTFHRIKTKAFHDFLHGEKFVMSNITIDIPILEAYTFVSFQTTAYVEFSTFADSLDLSSRTFYMFSLIGEFTFCGMNVSLPAKAFGYFRNITHFQMCNCLIRGSHDEAFSDVNVDKATIYRNTFENGTFSRANFEDFEKLGKDKFKFYDNDFECDSGYTWMGDVKTSDHYLPLNYCDGEDGANKTPMLAFIRGNGCQLQIHSAVILMLVALCQFII